jgi:hypothetical protein
LYADILLHVILSAFSVSIFAKGAYNSLIDAFFTRKFTIDAFITPMFAIEALLAFNCDMFAVDTLSKDIFAKCVFIFPKLVVVVNPIRIVCEFISVILLFMIVDELELPIKIVDVLTPTFKLDTRLSIPLILYTLKLDILTAGSTILYPDDAFEKLVITRGSLVILAASGL